MATVKSYLEGRVDYYRPTQDGLATARSRYNAIYNRLNDDHVVSMFETGSMTHGTGLWFHSDVDYFVRFYGTRPTPDTALGNIKASMQKLYPSTSIRVSRPAVKLDFTNGVKVELVPAYPTGVADEYWIPDPTDRSKWMKSAPDKHLQYVSAAQKTQPNTKSAIRLLKIWKSMKQVPVSSFYLEMRMAKYMTAQTSPVGLESAVRAVVGQLSTSGFASLQDPTSYAGLLHACSTSTYRETAKLKVATAHSRLLQAVLADLGGNPDGAVAELKRVFDY